ATRSVFEDGSITLPFLITIGMLSNHLFEHRHAHRDSVLHLVQNHRPLEIRHLAREFAPAIDGPRMHHDGLRFGQVHVLQLQTVEAEILAGFPRFKMGRSRGYRSWSNSLSSTPSWFKIR